jgi:hypothetical protein
MNGLFYNNASMEATVFIIPEDVIKILIFYSRTLEPSIPRSRAAYKDRTEVFTSRSGFFFQSPNRATINFDYY